MKRLSLVAVFLLGITALAATQFTRLLNLQVAGKSLLGSATESNAITHSYSASAVIDFASATITCEDSTGITVTGAVAGDACFVGAPTTISGAGTGLHSTFSCYVSAADTVKVRHCAAGTADNPASATYFVRVISAQ